MIMDAIQIIAKEYACDLVGEHEMGMRIIGEQFAKRLISALSARGFAIRDDDWQPIETAPRDGKHVLVGTFPTVPGHVTIATAHWWHEGREWALSVNYDGEHSDHGVEAPTHWRPLPEPPAFSR